jgi:hypothetical protein
LQKEEKFKHLGNFKVRHRGTEIGEMQVSEKVHRRAAKYAEGAQRGGNDKTTGMIGMIETIRTIRTIKMIGTIKTIKRDKLSCPQIFQFFGSPHFFPLFILIISIVINRSLLSALPLRTLRLCGELFNSGHLGQRQRQIHAAITALSNTLSLYHLQ